MPEDKSDGGTSLVARVLGVWLTSPSGRHPLRPLCGFIEHIVDNGDLEQSLSTGRQMAAANSGFQAGQRLRRTASYVEPQLGLGYIGRRRPSYGNFRWDQGSLRWSAVVRHPPRSILKARYQPASRTASPASSPRLPRPHQIDRRPAIKKMSGLDTRRMMACHVRTS